MGRRIDPHSHELLPQFLISLSVLPGNFVAIDDHLRRTIVLGYIFSHSQYVKGVEVDNELLLFLGELASLDIRSEVIGPPEPATLPAAVQAGQLGDAMPAPPPMLLHVINELPVLLRCPWPLLQAAHLLVTRRPRHCCYNTKQSLGLSENI
ncbi:hypothetical protein C4D60_Mb02t06470 [Musa balbisiana]|uniref:Uncharacterized protein n=1 Tax=Musa balbisiana TaxID=52838 RepID=A0A4S8I9K9_MUSBA|nr:hypothetical protein C4D60_Mb02t06470 [Musa balbisiana]